MSLIKETLDKAEEEKRRRRDDTGEDTDSPEENIYWKDIIVGALIVVFSAFIGVQFFLLIWLIFG